MSAWSVLNGLLILQSTETKDNTHRSVVFSQHVCRYISLKLRCHRLNLVCKSFPRYSKLMPKYTTEYCNLPRRNHTWHSSYFSQYQIFVHLAIDPISRKQHGSAMQSETYYGYVLCPTLHAVLINRFVRTPWTVKFLLWPLPSSSVLRALPAFLMRTFTFVSYATVSTKEPAAAAIEMQCNDEFRSCDNYAAVQTSLNLKTSLCLYD